MNSSIKKLIILSVFIVNFAHAAEFSGYQFDNAPEQLYVLVAAQYAIPSGISPHLIMSPEIEDTDMISEISSRNQEVEEAEDFQTDTIPDTHSITQNKESCKKEVLQTNTPVRRPATRSMNKKGGGVVVKEKKRKVNKYKYDNAFHYNCTRLRLEFGLTKEKSAKLAPLYDVTPSEMLTYFHSIVHCGHKIPGEFVITKDAILQANTLKKQK